MDRVDLKNHPTDSRTTITLGEKVGGDPILVEDEIVSDLEIGPGGLPTHATINGERRRLQVESFVVLVPPGRLRRLLWKVEDWVLRRDDD